MLILVLGAREFSDLLRPVHGGHQHLVAIDNDAKVLETDRISLRGLKTLAPDSALTAVVHHADGSEESFSVDHTLNEEQIGWFKAGSALNLLRQQAG